jgi:PAS domain S-box-containing protein
MSYPPGTHQSLAGAAARDRPRTLIALTPSGAANSAVRTKDSAMPGALFTDPGATAAARLIADALRDAMFRSAGFASIATDANGVILGFNAGAERMLGYAASDVVQRLTPADIADPTEIVARAEALSAEIGTVVAPGFAALVFQADRNLDDMYDLTYIRKDGTRLPVMVSVTSLRDADHRTIGYLLIGTDNSARRLVEEERVKLDELLRDQQFYTRSLFESNIDALMTIDALGNITDVNKQTEALTGRSRADMLGSPFKGYFTDSDRAEAGIHQVLREGKVNDYELTVRHWDGRETAVSYNATTLYDRERRLQGVFVAARDITERKRLDEVLLEKSVELMNAKVLAERANQAKSDFLSSMSHELRSPLNGILGFAQLMESDIPPPNESQKESIAQILHAGWHLLTLINEVLDLAKIESGKLSLSSEAVSLSEVMGECQGMLDGQARKRGLRMTFPPFINPVYVQADRTRLKQVLINLLSNAIKYNRPRGTVDVSFEVAHGRVRVWVRDGGAGMSAERLSQLFQPFNRLGQESSGEEGTGIGLVVARQLVELMDGSIGVESTVGEGSRFWIELAAATEPQFAQGDLPDMAAISGAAEGMPARRVLYVEDNLANLRLVERLLARRPDLHLISVGTGIEGVELARSGLPDVILMDINLPDISGIDAMKLIRDDPHTAQIPVIALSANAMPHDVKRGMKAGFFRYLAKPINVAEFMETLDLALAEETRR